MAATTTEAQVTKSDRIDTLETRRRRFEALDARAKAFWTEEVTRGLLGDKRLLLPPRDSAPLLRAIGLINGDTSMPPDAVRKYMQISHMVTLLEPTFLDMVERFDEVRVVDAGCGASFLTVLLAWVARHRWRRPVRVLGIDRNADLIARCRRRAAELMLEDALKFEASTIADVDLDGLWRRAFGASSPGRRVHAVIALHACDTATDDALALGVRAGAHLVAAAPCCHAELARLWSARRDALDSLPLAPIWRHPHLRREAGASMTDTLRTALLEAEGYRVTPMEFVPSTHTPKNTLLRAIWCGDRERMAKARRDHDRLAASLGGVELTLARRLREDGPTSRRPQSTLGRALDAI